MKLVQLPGEGRAVTLVGVLSGRVQGDERRGDRYNLLFGQRRAQPDVRVVLAVIVARVPVGVGLHGVAQPDALAGVNDSEPLHVGPDARQQRPLEGHADHKECSRAPEFGHLPGSRRIGRRALAGPHQHADLHALSSHSLDETSQRQDAYKYLELAGLSAVRGRACVATPGGKEAERNDQ